MDWLLSAPVAHRGLFGVFVDIEDQERGDAPKFLPENSISAFAKAVEYGYHVELDVRLLADGEVVVFHDADLERMTGVKGKVSRIGAFSLRDTPLLGSNESAPLLSEVLELISGRVGVIIELKCDNDKRELEKRVVEIVSGYSGDFAAASFDPASLKWFRRNAPDIKRGLIASGSSRDGSLFKRFARERLWSAESVKPDFIAYDLRDLPCAAAQKLRRSGIPLLAWTIRNESDMNKARREADNFIFEGLLP